MARLRGPVRKQREGRQSSERDDTAERSPPVQFARAATATPLSEGRPRKGPAGAALEWLLMLVLVVYASYVINHFQSGRLPAPRSAAEAGIRGFAEVTAWEHVRSLSQLGPHPVGSAALERALEYVYAELGSIKETADDYVDIELEVFEPRPGLERLDGGLFFGKSLVYVNLKHLVVRVTPADFPEAKENAILVSSHIDTVITSPGAGDCSSCVGVMLELVRALSHWAQGSKNAVIFLFNTGEEEGLVGAHSFITQHPWNATIRAAIDVESMGVGGRSILFQAGPDKWLLNLYASVAKYPAAQVAAQDVFQFGLVKSATDFQVYKEIGGLSGLDFAFIENSGVYHTKNDKIEFLRPGSLQHIGEDLLALLQAASLSDELQFVRTNSSGSEKMEMVYFDILGKWMLTYPQAAGKTQQFSLLSQAAVLFFSSLYLSGISAFIAFVLALLCLAFTWILSIFYVLIVAAVLPYLTHFPVPYIAHPWLVVGLFGAPAAFGALLGHALGRSFLVSYLKGRGHTELQVEWLVERFLFKAGIFQWMVILGLATWVGAGASYIAVFWILPPALAYGFLEAQFSPQQRLRGLQRVTLWLSMALGVVVSATPIIQLTSVLVGNLVRFDRNPGGVPVWAGNALTGGMIAACVCLVLVYLFPYAHRSGGLAWILTGLSALFFMTLFLVMTQIFPAFTEYTGRAIQAMHVIDSSGSTDTSAYPDHYISLVAFTPGKFEKEMKFLKEENFTCGQSSIDFVSHDARYGCTKPLDNDEALSSGQPSLRIVNDRFISGQRVTVVKMNSGSAHRWHLGINTTAVESFRLEAVVGKGGEVLIPEGTIVGVDGWHKVQFTSDADGPINFDLTLVWHSSFEEGTFLKWGSESLVLKLRTDVNLVTDELDEVLSKLPSWCVLLGKSTLPYTLTYLTDLKAPLPS